MLSKTTTANLKGLAILVVMLGHLVTIHKSSLNYDMRYFAAFSVSIFLILSGYGLCVSSSSNGLKGFFKKRLSAVMLPFVLVTIIVSAAYGILFTDPIRVLRTITLTNPNNQIDGTMWFIYYISLWYVLFFAAYSIFKNKHLRVASLIAIAIYIYFGNSMSQFLELDFQFKLHAFSFVAGVAIGEYKDKVSSRLLLSVSVVVFTFALKSLFTEFSMVSYQLSCISFGLLVISLFAFIRIDNPILSFFGDMSYEMYLFEGVLLGVGYSENHIVNAVMFVFFTTATASLFKRGLAASKLRYASMLNRGARA